MKQFIIRVGAIEVFHLRLPLAQIREKAQDLANKTKVTVTITDEFGGKIQDVSPVIARAA